jgi:hypothetical protein
MKRYKATLNLAAIAASTLALTGISANAATVWNVNIGGTDLAGYQGAATENAAAGSTWNAVTSTTVTTLDDSTGSDAAGVSLKITPTADSTVSFSGRDITGDDIFDTWMKDGNGGPPDTSVNDDLFIVTFGNLNSGSTYDLVVYSDWFWGNTAGNPVTQTAGTGLTGTFDINSESAGHSNGNIGALLEDTDSASANTPGTLATNYARFNGLSPDGGNTLAFSMGGVNSPINGLQLIETVPEPSTTALLGLGGLALILRRRK